MKDLAMPGDATDVQLPFAAVDEDVGMAMKRSQSEPYGQSEAQRIKDGKDRGAQTDAEMPPAIRITSAPVVRRPPADRRWRPALAQLEQPAKGPEAGQEPEKPAECSAGHLRHLLVLTLGATGVVFGDIGTSPLYTFSGIFVDTLHQRHPTPVEVQEAFSMIFWLLTWVVCVKYIGIVLRVSHHGEGGTFALMQTIINSKDSGGAALSAGAKSVVLFAAMLGCALIIGDGCITPVISVLGALEGIPGDISVDERCLVAILVLVFIFMVQRRGSQVIGMFAGPIVLVWFFSCGAMGVYNLVAHPESARLVAQGLSPARAFAFWTTGAYRGADAWRSLAGVVLSVTGAEALYADMGHFGAAPITLAWFSMVYPCLVLQYMGQAAMLCENPGGVVSPFYNAVPPALKWPVTLLATLAAVIASQAMITGLFTMLTQAYALRLVPRIQVLHTNPNEHGQVYIPEVNWVLCVMCITLCVGFRTAAALAGAYGIAVTCTFVVTTCLLAVVLRRVWHWRWPTVLLVLLPMLTVDLLLSSANLLKIIDSGWVPILIAAVTCFFMHTHHWGRSHEEQVFALEAQGEVALMGDGAHEGTAPLMLPAAQLELATVSTVPGLLHVLRSSALVRTPTTAVFMTPYAWRVPRTVGALATTLGCLPEGIVLLNLSFEGVPFVAESARSTFTALGEGLFSVVLHFGYAEPLTAARFGVHAAIAKVAREQVGQYAMLAPLLDLDAHAQKSEATALDTAVERAEAPAAPAAGGEADPERGGDLPPQHNRGATIVLHKLHYAARPEHGFWTRLRIMLYALIVLNARKAIAFFGLEDGNTMEISVVRFL